jgi:hypothetical protein
VRSVAPYGKHVPMGWQITTDVDEFMYRRLGFVPIEDRVVLAFG